MVENEEFYRIPEEENDNLESIVINHIKIIKVNMVKIEIWDVDYNVLKIIHINFY